MNPPNYKATLLSPIIPVADIQRSIGFYSEVLGFSITIESKDYAILTKDAVSLQLARAENQAALDATRNHISVYLEINDVDSLWPHVAQFKDRYKIRDLFDRDYGMREFHIIDPDGCLIFCGTRI